MPNLDCSTWLPKFCCERGPWCFGRSGVEAVHSPNRCNLNQCVFNCNAHCLHRRTLWRNADQLRLNVDQGGLHIDTGWLYLEQLRQDGYEVGLNTNTASTVPHQARRNADEVGLDSHACFACASESMQTIAAAVWLLTS